MPTITLHPPFRPAPAPASASATTANSLPHLLQTPSGLAVIELQGTINIPTLDPDNTDGTNNFSSGNDDENIGLESTASACVNREIPIGRLEFPLYSAAANSDTDADGNAGENENNQDWMKHVHLYVGHHQRLTGEVRRLGWPLAVVRRRKQDRQRQEQMGRSNGTENGEGDELEAVEIVRHKIVFSTRPEPV